jgi:hypothetical protein
VFGTRVFVSKVGRSTDSDSCIQHHEVLSLPVLPVLYGALVTFSCLPFLPILDDDSFHQRQNAVFAFSTLLTFSDLPEGRSHASNISCPLQPRLSPKKKRQQLEQKNVGIIFRRISCQRCILGNVYTESHNFQHTEDLRQESHSPNLRACIGPAGRDPQRWQCFACPRAFERFRGFGLCELDRLLHLRSAVAFHSEPDPFDLSRFDL